VESEVDKPSPSTPQKPVVTQRTIASRKGKGMAPPQVLHPAAMVSDEFDDLTEMESADYIMENQIALATSKDPQSKPASQPQAPPAKLTYADVVATMQAPGAWPRGKPAETT
jgi:hypothetical protein